MNESHLIYNICRTSPSLSLATLHDLLYAFSAQYSEIEFSVHFFLSLSQINAVLSTYMIVINFDPLLLLLSDPEGQGQGLLTSFVSLDLLYVVQQSAGCFAGLAVMYQICTFCSPVWQLYGDSIFHSLLFLPSSLQRQY